MCCEFEERLMLEVSVGQLFSQCAPWASSMSILGSTKEGATLASVSSVQLLSRVRFSATP